MQECPGLHISTLETDRGGEFKGRAIMAFYKEHNIRWVPKRGWNKASYAEAYIGIVKRR